MLNRTFTKDELANLNHALKHLTANNIHNPESSCSGWYSGNRSQFIKRHIKAIEMVQKWLSGNK